MQSMRDMLMLKAEEKNIDLRVHIDNDIPKRLVGDPTRINQVLINLAGNAVKFTDKGYVEVRASLKKGKIKNTGYSLTCRYRHWHRGRICR